VRTDEEAWALVAENLPLVVWIINRWCKSYSRGADFDDAYGCGTLGLFRAAQLWEPQRGKFSTYAVAWVRQSIECGMIEANQRRARDTGRDAPETTLSLDQTYGNDGDQSITLASYLEAPDQPDTDAEWVAAVASVAARLHTDRDRAILAQLALGERSDIRIAKQFGISREMVRRDDARIRRMLGRTLGVDVPTCVVDGCDGDPASGSYGACYLHYQRHRRHGNVAELAGV